MTVMVCIWLTSRRIVAEKVRVLFLFGTMAGNDRDGLMTGRAAPAAARLVASVAIANRDLDLTSP